MSILSFSLLFLSFEFIFCYKCCEIDLRDPPGYFLVKSNAKSLKSVIARKEVSDVRKCEEFAESKKGLAFNFGRDNSKHNWSMEDDFYNVNCVVLECPEIHNFTDLKNVTGIQYYSSYPYWMGTDYNLTNGTLLCVPGTGLFLFFSNRLNFTDARLSCQKFNGTLAHVISEKRTEGLASFLDNTPTYVGMSSQGHERVWKNEFDEPLECFDYLAWDEGEPNHSRGCVTLFRSSPKAIPTWKVSSCRLKFPYICEISPAKYRKYNENKNKQKSILT